IGDSSKSPISIVSEQAILRGVARYEQIEKTVVVIIDPAWSVKALNIGLGVNRAGGAWCGCAVAVVSVNDVMRDFRVARRDDEVDVGHGERVGTGCRNVCALNPPLVTGRRVGAGGSDSETHVGAETD